MVVSSLMYTRQTTAGGTKSCKNIFVDFDLEFLLDRSYVTRFLDE